jgi:hypothetical protein
MKVLTRFQEALLKEYNRTRKQLRTRLKHSMAPADVKAFIKESFTELTERQASIIARYIYKAYKSGTSDAKKDLKSVKISAAAPIPDMGNVGMDLSEVSQLQMNRIFHTRLGAIGDYNINLSKTLQHQYNVLLSDNKLIASLNRDGWTPWLDETLKKRGTDPAIITLIKGQKTSKQMINIFELHGIKGGMHPNQVAKRLIPHINRFFGPEGVSIDNIGKTVKRFRIDADGNYGWFDHKITKIYKATPRTYSRLIARDTLRHAMMHGQTVTKGSGPQYHGNCGCDLRPVWKKDSPLASQNKPEAFYEKQRNMHFLRANDLKNYNAAMPRGMKLKYKVVPGNIEIRAIRHEMLGKPAAIKPSMPVTKPEVLSKKDAFVQLKQEERTHADELWKKTDKDGCEHIKLTNSKTTYADGNKNSVAWSIPNGPFKARHTHPEWDSPLSGPDLANFLTINNMRRTAASSPERVYVAIKTGKTIHPWKTRAVFIDDFKMTATEINKEKTMTFLGKEFRNPTKMEAQKIWHDANDEANKLFAKQYKYEYISFTRK